VNHGHRLLPDRTALLIVDPYNDFMSEGGKYYEATRQTVTPYPGCQPLASTARAACSR
jgi:hypothetical protein